VLLGARRPRRVRGSPPQSAESVTPGSGFDCLSVSRYIWTTFVLRKARIQKEPERTRSSRGSCAWANYFLARVTRKRPTQASLLLPRFDLLDLEKTVSPASDVKYRRDLHKTRPVVPGASQSRGSCPPGSRLRRASSRRTPHSRYLRVWATRWPEVYDTAQDQCIFLC
jgi:hypothetical protein